MNDSEFDNMFRKKLQSFESEVSVDMWQRIIKKKRKRRIGFLVFCFVTALILFIGVESVYFFDVVKNDKYLNGNTKTDSIGKDNRGAFNIAPDKNSGVSYLTDSNIIRQKNNRIYKRLFAKNKKNNRNITSENFLSMPKDKFSFDKTAATNKSKIQSNDNSKSDSLKNKIFNKKDNLQKKSADQFSEKKLLLESQENNKIALELYTSPDEIFKTLNADISTYEKVLRDAGNMQLSFSIGMRVKIMISKTISAKLGIEYRNVKEKIAFINSINGLDYKTTNSYKFINAPFLLSYRTNLLQTWLISFNGGAILNVSSKYKGAIPSIDLQPINIEDANVYKRNLGLAVYFGIDFSKKVNKKIDFFGEPYFQYNMENMTNSFQSFKQKISAFGVSFGVRYELFRSKVQ